MGVKIKEFYGISNNDAVGIIHFHNDKMYKYLLEEEINEETLS